MNREKIIILIKNAINTKIGIGIISAIVVGAISYNVGDFRVKEVENKLVVLNNTIHGLEADKIELEGNNKMLSDKVAQAKPFFDMKAEEQKAMEERVAKEKSDSLAKLKAEEEAKVKADLEARTKTLSNGNYTVGEDFEAGKYDIVAISGGGNVMCSGSINAIMGPSDDDFYQKEYKNIKFRDGQVLDIRDVTVQLIPKQ